MREGSRALLRGLGVVGVVDATGRLSNRLIGRERPKVSVVIPTIGRSTLQRAVDSARWAYEVIVVYDAEAVPDATPAGAVAYACGPTHHWGAEQRTLGMARATGTHLAFLDDDDVYADGAGEIVLRALAGWPSRVHIFRMRQGERIFGGHGCVWRGGVGTPMFVVPKDATLGRWSTRYEGDFDFISETLAASRRRPRFHQEVIALVDDRPALHASGDIRQSELG